MPTATLVVLAYTAAAVLLGWGYFRRYPVTRPPLGVFNLRAALTACRATRGRDGVRSSRFYWLNPENLVLVTDAESLDVFSGPPRPVRQERWGDARQGEEVYGSAQRA